VVEHPVRSLVRAELERIVRELEDIDAAVERYFTQIAHEQGKRADREEYRELLQATLVTMDEFLKGADDGDREA
jgi:hypothetical protein